MARLLTQTFKIQNTTSCNYIERCLSPVCKSHDLVKSTKRSVHKCSNIITKNRAFDRNYYSDANQKWNTYELLKAPCYRNSTNSLNFNCVRTLSTRSSIHSRHRQSLFSSSLLSSINKCCNITRYNHSEVHYNSADQSSSNIDWDLKEVYTCCNQDVWEEKLEGFDLRFKYIDTHNALDNKTQRSAKVIVGLFGHPGSHKDIQQLLQPFAEQGYRIIIPIMPGFGETKAVTKKEEVFFTHSSTEKLHLLVQLLSYLNVKEVHSMVAHDSASGMLSMMLATTDVVQSAVFVCPIPCHSPPKAYQPRQYLKGLVNWYENGLSYFKPILLALMAANIKKNKINVTPRYTYPFTLSALNLGYDYIPGLMLAIEAKPVHISIIYCNEDSFVEKDLTLEYADIMGIKESHNALNSDSPGIGIHRKPGSNQGIRRALELDSSSHFPHHEDQYRQFIVEEIQMLMQYDRS